MPQPSKCFSTKGSWRERETETDRHRHTQRERETDRQTDTKRDRHTHTRRERERERKREKERKRERERESAKVSQCIPKVFLKFTHTHLRKIVESFFYSVFLLCPYKWRVFPQKRTFNKTIKFLFFDLKNIVLVSSSYWGS